MTDNEWVAVDDLGLSEEYGGDCHLKYLSKLLPEHMHREERRCRDKTEKSFLFFVYFFFSLVSLLSLQTLETVVCTKGGIFTTKAGDTLIIGWPPLIATRLHRVTGWSARQ